MSTMPSLKIVAPNGETVSITPKCALSLVPPVAWILCAAREPPL